VRQILFGWSSRRRMSCAENVARMGDMRNAYKTLIGKPENHFENVHKFQNNIRMDLREEGWELTGFIWFRILNDCERL
jgi:hypothetical protein